ncbi:hypothetical protein SAMN05216227_10346 [Pseudorhodobacter antarcticus]|jgi:hypothetical protein|uniref:Uncharacterized protein n=1 Tax=Pseudorhodobacter antarcticus TaxID=1077947 RepID=A0A1H8KQL6_9RHOB|nr:hypothetical protein [Pseudorhodobacter antarcticus]SEN95101.1 hypothetical protein SAMN05216227_10346 [Pseudorhodobacter antarcticus]
MRRKGGARQPPSVEKRRDIGGLGMISPLVRGTFGENGQFAGVGCGLTLRQVKACGRLVWKFDD